MAEDSKTLASLLLRNNRRWGNKVAMRHKRYGLWNQYTWRESYDQVKYAGLGLLALGLAPDEKIGFLGDIEPELYWSMFGTWAIGSVTVGLFVDALPSELCDTIGRSECRFVVAKDQEQVDKLLQVRDQLAGVARVIWWDPRGMRPYRDPWLLSFTDLLALGRQHEQEHPGEFERRAEAVGPLDDAAIYWTSGTTGGPKGVVHTHESLLRWCDMALGEALPWPTTEDNCVPYFPVATTGDIQFGSVGHLLTGIKVNLVEKPDTVTADLREISPSYLLWAPRQWESLAALIQTRVGDADPLKRLAYRLLMPVGYKAVNAQEEGKPLAPWWRALRPIANYLLFRPVRDRLGLSKTKVALNGGFVLGADTLRFFRAIGVDLRQQYGISEAGALFLHHPGRVHPNTVGEPVSTVQTKLTPDGEMLVKSPALFAGYYRNPEATSAVLDDDGWYHTGDVGYFREDGELFFVGRVKELSDLAGGIKYSPQLIESQLRFGAYISDAMALGGPQRPYIAAIITINFDSVSKWAEKQHIAYTTMVELSQKDEVARLVLQDVRRVNRALPPPLRVKRYVVFHKEFDADEGELTRTRKLRRGVMEERYGELIEALYAGENEVAVNARVVYRDGRVGAVAATLKVRDVPDEVR